MGGVEAKKKMFGLGYNSFLLYIHVLMLVPIAIGVAYIFGALYFSKEPTDSLVTRLKMVSWVTFIFVIGLLVFGVLPDINVSTGTLNASYSGDYGNFTQSVSDASVASFTGPLYFDIMEHISFIGVALAGAVTGLIWSLGPLVITVRKARLSVLSLLIVAVAWVVVLAVIGLTLTHTLTFPPQV